MSISTLSFELQQEILAFQEEKLESQTQKLSESHSQLEVIARYLPKLKRLFEQCQNLPKPKKAELVNQFVENSNWIEPTCNDLARVKIYNLLNSKTYNRALFIEEILLLIESSVVETLARNEYLENGILPPVGCEWEATPEYYHHNSLHIPMRYDLASQRKHPLRIDYANDNTFFDYFKSIIRNLGILYNYEDLYEHKYLEFKTRAMYSSQTVASFLKEISKMEEFRFDQIGSKNVIKPITMHISLENLLGIDFLHYPEKILDTLSNIVALGYTSPERLKQRHMTDSIRTNYAMPMISGEDKTKKFKGYQGRIEIRPSDFSGENTFEIIDCIQYLTLAMYGSISDNLIKSKNEEEYDKDMHFGGYIEKSITKSRESRLNQYPEKISSDLEKVWKELQENLYMILTNYNIGNREFDISDKDTKASLSKKLTDNPNISLEIRKLVRLTVSKIKLVILDNSSTPRYPTILD